MSNDDGMMTSQEVADLLGIGLASWYSLRSQGYAPQSDDFGRSEAGRLCHLWKRSTIERFVRERKGRGYRSDIRRAG